MTCLAWNRVRTMTWTVIVGVALVGTGITLADRVQRLSIPDSSADLSSLGTDSGLSDLVDEIGENLAPQASDPLPDFLRNFQRQFGDPPIQAAASAFIDNGSR